MKKFIKYIIAFFVMLPIVSCNDGIDSITQVNPGADATAPVVTIKTPLNDAKFKVNEPIMAIDIEFEVTDDIEVGSISVFIDGSQIATFSDFKDYRRVLQAVTASNIATGAHQLKVTATDLDGKSTSSTVNFEKEPAYIPLFSNEILYMAFDGDYTELISVTQTTKVGLPLFAGTSVVGTNAYKGANDAYLTFPTSGWQLGSEVSASFWYKVNGDPDRAGILVMGPIDAANPTAQNNRQAGFRLFREGSATSQRIKLHVGNTNATPEDEWNDGGVIDVTNNEWVHVAFTISATQSIVYLNGVAVNTAALAAPIDWTGCDLLSIMSGAPRFTEWNHKSDTSYMDDLRMFSKALTQAEIQNIINVTNPYVPASGETLFMPFDNNYVNVVGNTVATKVGNPSFSGEAKKGANAYAGADNTYLTLPTTGLTGESFSAVMWYKLNAIPDRAGILVAGPEDTANADYPTTQNNRTKGFRFFRESGADGKQRFKLQVGDGSANDVWVDGGGAADVAPDAGWIHLAFTISPTKAIVYINGLPVKETTFTGIDWTGCNLLSIMSGAPRFNEWNHKSDSSYLDELHLYNKTLTQAEIQGMM